MAFPIVLDVVTSSQTGQDNIDVALPETVTSGDLLLICLAESNSALAATPSGWTLLNRRGGGTDNSERYIFERIADGTEGGTTVNFSTGGTSTNWAGVCVSVGQWEGTVSGRDFQVTTDVSGTSIDPAGNLLTAAWGVDDNLWVLFTASAKNDNTITSWSTGYDSNQTEVSSGAGAGQGCHAGVATKEDAIDEDNPDSITFTTAQNDINAWLFVIQPGSSGGTGGGGGAGVGNDYGAILSSYLISLGNTPGSIDDMMLSQLETATGSTGTTNGLLVQYLLNKGVTKASLNDMLVEYLNSLGYSGSINEMLIASFLAGDFF